MSITRRLLLAACIAVGLARPAMAEDVPLYFAAASLKPALDQIISRYHAATGKEIKVSYGASGALVKQLQAGAPASAFISADVPWFQAAVDAKLIDLSSKVILAGNQLVVVSPKDSAFSYKGDDLSRAIQDGKLAVGEPKSVPVGTYTIEALTHLQQWEAVKPKAVYAENVRAVLELTARGEAAAGIVYATDALSEPRVKTVYMFAESTHAPVVYPAGLAIAASADAKAFFQYLQGDEAKAILKGFGFTQP